MDDVRREGPAKVSSLTAAQLGDRPERTRRAVRIAVVILGMHRSGTSAISRVFSLLGCDLPKTLMGPSASNEAGHWESDAITAFNEELLASLGSAWNDWSPIDPIWRQSPKAEEFKARAVALLDQEFGGSHLFVLKDPRVCLLAPFWRDVLQSAGIQPAFVSPVRNPLEVAASIAARDGTDPALGQLIWLRHVLEAEAAMRGAPRFHCSYEQLLSEWPALVRGVEDMLGVRFPRVPSRAEGSIDGFLSNRHRHHHETREAVLKNPRLAAWIRDAFDVFDRWTANGESPDDYATLDRIRAEFDAAAPAFVRVVRARQDASAAVEALQQRLAQLSAEHANALENAQAAKAEQQRDRALSEIRLHGIETQQRNTEARVAELHQALDAAQRALEDQRNETRRVTDNAAAETKALRAEAEAEAATAKALHAEADAAAAEIRVLRAGAEAAASEIRVLRAEAEAVAEDAKALRAEAEAAEGAVLERDEIIALLTERLEIAAARAQADAEERSGLDAVLAEAEQALVSLIAERDEARARADELLVVIERTAQRELADAELQRAGVEAERQREQARAEAEHRRDQAMAEAKRQRDQADAEAALQRERAALAERTLDERTRELASLTRLLRQQEEASKAQLNERFNEAATLTRLLREEEGATRAAAHDREWMRRVAATLLAGGGSLRGRLVQLLPNFVLRGWALRHLKRQNLFDAEAYLRANPDVGRAGENPLRHYIHFGVKEGRRRE